MNDWLWDNSCSLSKCAIGPSQVIFNKARSLVAKVTERRTGNVLIHPTWIQVNPWLNTFSIFHDLSLPWDFALWDISFFGLCYSRFFFELQRFPKRNPKKRESTNFSEQNLRLICRVSISRHVLTTKLRIANEQVAESSLQRENIVIGHEWLELLIAKITRGK